jgi:NADH dehydrogenase (ubiquinone) Fe-S protein 4
MTSASRVTRSLRPIRSVFVRYNSSKPPPPTVTHIPLAGEKTIPAVDQTTTNVPAPSPPLPDHAAIAADVVSGAPEDLHRRPVRIYRPAKSAMQSGLHGNLHWRLDWDVRPEDNRWEHPVMYWAARYVVLVTYIVPITCRALE